MDSTVRESPSGLRYSIASAVYIINEQIIPNTPTVNGTVTEWSVEPDLIEGLDLDPGTGIISGTPTEWQPETQYTITAGNSYGSTTATISITVNTDLTYSSTLSVYMQNEEIADNAPTVTGTVTSWSVSPALPDGLVFDTDTGIISGTPTVLQSAAEYTITAANSYGSTTAVITITIISDARTFRALDTTDYSYYDVAATCKKIGDHCILYLEDTVITVSDATAIAIAAEFDANIHYKMQMNFGTESDVDSSGRVILLLLDIIDGYSGSGGYVAGYFDPTHQFSEATFPNSNEADMLFLDVYPLDAGSSEFYQTTAHEFQHLINFTNTYMINGTEQEIWINEGLSSGAEYIYSGAQIQSHIDYYNADSLDTIIYGNNFFVWNDTWGDVLAEYSTVYLFFQWLQIHASNGTGIYKDILNSDYRDYRAVTTSASTKISLSFSNWSILLRTWMEANLLNAETGYKGYNGIIDTTAYVFASWDDADDNWLFSPGEGITAFTTGGTFTPDAGSGSNITYVGLTYSGTEDTTSPYTGDAVLTYNANPAKDGVDETGFVSSIKSSINTSRSVSKLFRTIDLSKPIPSSYPVSINLSAGGGLKDKSHKPGEPKSAGKGIHKGKFTK